VRELGEGPAAEVEGRNGDVRTAREGAEGREVDSWCEGCGEEGGDVAAAVGFGEGDEERGGGEEGGVEVGQGEVRGEGDGEVEVD
jgi:hypothetical protein